MQMSILGIDLGKNSCSVVGLDAGGKVVLRRAMRRETVIAFCAGFLSISALHLLIMILLNRRTPMIAPAGCYQFRVLEP
jgi:hypothetical protein